MQGLQSAAARRNGRGRFRLYSGASAIRHAEPTDAIADDREFTVSAPARPNGRIGDPG
ncbi:hypothetical protein [Azospirillum palustre]